MMRFCAKNIFSPSIATYFPTFLLELINNAVLKNFPYTKTGNLCFTQFGGH